MKKTLSFIIFFFCISAIWFGCKKIPIGFLSDHPFYTDSPFRIEPGKAITTSEIQVDGSTKPLKVTLLNIKKKGTETRADELYTEHDVYVFNKAFNPEQDTTIDQLNSIRSMQKKPMFEFLENSGQFIFNSGSKVIPAGSNYTFDVEIGNESGKKLIKNIGELNFVEPLSSTINRNTATYLQDGSTASGTLPNVELSITRLNDQGTNVILKYTDENGVIFNPKAGELIIRGDRPRLDTYAKFHPLLKTDTSINLNFEILPFPYKTLSGYGAFDIFYRIPSQFSKVVNPASTFPAETKFSINPAIGFQILQEGTYLVVVKIKGVRHK